MVISVLLLICVCARSDYRPDPWETERVRDRRPSDFQCYCVSAVVSLYPAALQPRLFISLALTGIVLKLAVKELIKQSLCLGWTNAPLYRLKLAVKSKSHRHQPNNTHTPARAARKTRLSACSGYYCSTDLLWLVWFCWKDHVDPVLCYRPNVWAALFHAMKLEGNVYQKRNTIKVYHKCIESHDCLWINEVSCQWLKATSVTTFSHKWDLRAAEGKICRELNSYRTSNDLRMLVILHTSHTDVFTVHLCRFLQVFSLNDNCIMMHEKEQLFSILLKRVLFWK